MQLRAFTVTLAIAALPLSGGRSTPGEAALDRQFQQNVRPFVAKYCVSCHSGQSPAAQFDLKSFATLSQVEHDFPHWSLILSRLTAQEMPPKPMPQPPEEARKQVMDWIESLRAAEIHRNAGDPGMVLPRRLSNSEYDYTVRDLTGQDIKPAREFPVDPANTAGFDNSGESLTMSPALLNKYLQAARAVADHAVLTPDGIDFALYPMLVETDRDKYAIERIVNFYHQQPTDYAAYFEASWRYEHRAALGQKSATLASVAAETHVSAKYLPMVWGILHDKDAIGPVAKLQAMFNKLPAPGGDDIHPACVAMRNFVVKIRHDTAMQYAAPIVRGLPAGSQPLLDWKLNEFAAHRRESDPKDLRNDTDPAPVVPAIPRYPGLHAEAAPRWAALTAKARATDQDLIVPAADRTRYEAAFQRFASVFPDEFFVSERGRYFPDDSQDKGRFLSAGYHNTMGYFRDDRPLMELILDDEGNRQLNRLWDEFDFIASYTSRTFVQYFMNQSGEVDGKGAESGSPRPLNHAITDEAVIFQFRDKYLAKAAANPVNDPVSAQAIREHFEHVNNVLRGLEKEHTEAEPKHVEAILRFAARAYRRPLTQAEAADLTAYYHTLREKNGLSHEDAIRESITSVLMSPDFLYRVDLLDANIATSPNGVRKVNLKNQAPFQARPVSSYALASKLSYFLWSSMPDEELLRHAASGDLQKSDVLMSEVRRMLKDERVRGFATEFAGNWLNFRHFETTNTVDRDRFPTFNNDLRAAMFEEPVRFIENLARNDGSVLDLIYGHYTFVNPPLAKHYGMPDVPGKNDDWVRVDDADKYGRGGILPMAVFLTQNSPGLRTSPVKRGFWVVHTVLGQVIPPPPPVVPELPADESKSELPLRDALAKHRSVPMCAACHFKFDSFGLAFEGYGPVGEARAKDLAGRPIDAHAEFPGGWTGSGIEAIETYIRDHRQADFVDNLSRKLLAYSLDRSLQLSDEALIDRMKSKLATKEYRFDSLVETIVTSPQFLNARVAEARQTAQMETKR
ncbi:MAG TPA: DUF1592 domain-containing protein [Bryobacteraceae bacterium]|nr:DUF1592 domain-containing protein [Bryobacteraceae bacterium]